MQILIAYDGSAHADAAIDDLRLAGLPPNNEVLVVSVAHGNWPPFDAARVKLGQFDGPWRATVECAEVLAEDGKRRVRSKFPAWHVTSQGLWGDPAKTLLKTIDIWKPELLVVGSHGRSFGGRVLLGSVSTELVHHAPCSVRIVRRITEKADGEIRIEVATDGSDPARACVEYVARRTWPTGTRARVVGVLQSLSPVAAMPSTFEGQAFGTEVASELVEESFERERARLQEAIDGGAKRLGRSGLTVETVMIDGNPRNEINMEAERWHADTIFVGARGLGAVDRLLLGSVSGAVVAHAHCAVEVVRYS